MAGAGPLEEIQDYIYTAGLGWDTTNCFISRMPDLPDRALALHEYSGRFGAGAPAYTLGGGPMAYEELRLQIMVRDTTYAGARSGVVALRQVLELVGDQTLSGTYYMRIMAMTGMLRMEPDTKDRETFTMNLHVMKEPS